MEELRQSAYTALRCRDWARIDLRLDGARTSPILEVKPLPGILPNPAAQSSFQLAAWVAGLSFPALIHRVVDEAERCYAAVSKLPGQEDCARAGGSINENPEAERALGRRTTSP